MAFPSDSLENYLKQIYELSLDERPVKTSHLAEALGVSPAAVTEMVKRLEHQGLLSYQPYHGVELAEEGLRRALRVVRRHRLWEVFLQRVLKVPWPEVHRHACRLEHATDDELADRLDAFLGYPRSDPHGDPIPDAEGKVEEVERLRLSELPEGARAELVQVTDEDPKLLVYLGELGLRPGARVTLEERAPFNGPLTLTVDGVRQVVGREVAETLLVHLEEDEGQER